MNFSVSELPKLHTQLSQQGAIASQPIELEMLARLNSMPLEEKKSIHWQYFLLYNSFIEGTMHHKLKVLNYLIDLYKEQKEDEVDGGVDRINRRVSKYETVYKAITELEAGSGMFNMTGMNTQQRQKLIKRILYFSTLNPEFKTYMLTQLREFLPYVVLTLPHDATEKEEINRILYAWMLLEYMGISEVDKWYNHEDARGVHSMRPYLEKQFEVINNYDYNNQPIKLQCTMWSWYSVYFAYDVTYNASTNEYTIDFSNKLTEVHRNYNLADRLIAKSLYWELIYYIKKINTEVHGDKTGKTALEFAIEIQSSIDSVRMSMEKVGGALLYEKITSIDTPANMSDLKISDGKFTQFRDIPVAMMGVAYSIGANAFVRKNVNPKITAFLVKDMEVGAWYTDILKGLVHPNDIRKLALERVTLEYLLPYTKGFLRYQLTFRLFQGVHNVCINKTIKSILKISSISDPEFNLSAQEYYIRCEKEGA